MDFSPEACEWIGLGYLPDRKAITWPERNDQGEIVGIGCRKTQSGSKRMLPGSRRGLIYAPDPEWAGVPAYIDHPILIVEGVTDALACLSRQCYSIGLPSATGTAESNAYLKKLVKGRDIALTCENDLGVGAVAFLERACPLSQVASNVYAIYPPSEVKDMREWFAAEGRNAILQIENQIKFRRPWSNDPGTITVSSDVLVDTAPVYLAKTFLAEMQGSLDASPIRYWRGRWYVFESSHYTPVDESFIRKEIYRFLTDKKILVK